MKGVFDIPFGRPRELALKRDPKFLEIEDAIWQLVEEECRNDMGMRRCESQPKYERSRPRARATVFYQRYEALDPRRRRPSSC